MDLQCEGNLAMRGRHRLNLVVDLASDELTHQELAVKYEKHVSSIDQFSVRNSQEIAEVRRHILDQASAEEVGLWVLVKRNRWANYQQWIEDMEEILSDPGSTWQERIKAVREARALQRQIAEERGELRPGIDMSRGVVRYIIEGLDSWEEPV